MSAPRQDALPFGSNVDTGRPLLSSRTDSCPDSLPELLSIRAAARFLGVGVSTLYSLLAEGRFPVTPVKVGNTLKLPRRRLEQWLAEGSELGH
jgi:excisionase family DNA binding protein